MLRRPQLSDRPSRPGSRPPDPDDTVAVRSVRSGQGRLTGAVTLAAEDPDALIDALSVHVRAGDSISRGEDGLVTVVATGLLTERDLRLLAQRLVAAAGSATASRGVGLAVGGGDQLAPDDEVLARAAVAQRASARVGRIPVAFGEAAALEEQRRADLAADLADGVTAGRFEAHLQPVVDLHSGAPVRFEALARWCDPVRQLVRPAAFVDVAAETGLLWAITEQVVAGALGWAVRWERATGVRRPLLMPVHPSQVAGPALDRLLALLASALADQGTDPGNLILVPDPGSMAVTADERALARILAAGLGLAARFEGTAPRQPGGPDDPRVSTVLVRSELLAPPGGGGPGSGPAAGSVASIGSLVGRWERATKAVIVVDVAADGQLAAAREVGASQAQGFHLHRPVSPERLEPLVLAGSVVGR